MNFAALYTEALAETTWTVPQNFDACFNWVYDTGRAGMMGLYQKGKEFQWDATTRIDWSQELDEENPQQLPEEMLPIAGMDIYQKMSAKEKAKVRRHFQAWQLSQFMQGEQGALICAAKIVTQVPDIDSKFYASTQVIDEARHVESYRLLLSKFGVAYAMTPPLKELIDQTLRDSRWATTTSRWFAAIRSSFITAGWTTSRAIQSARRDSSTGWCSVACIAWRRASRIRRATCSPSPPAREEASRDARRSS